MNKLNIQGEGVITSVIFRQDGKHIYGGSGLGTVRKWETTGTGKEVGRVMTVGVEVGAVTVSRDGLWIVGGTTLGSAIVWKGTTHEKVFDIKSAHVDWVLSVDISPDCKTFVTGSYDETAVFWELETGRKKFVLKHPSHVGGVRFSPSGDRLATATWGDLAIHIFDSRNGELLVRIPNAVSSVSPNPLAWSDNGQRIFAPYEVSINQFDVATSARVSSWRVDPHIHVQLIALANSGQFIVCSIDRTVTIWDTLTNATICPPLRLTGRLKSVAISQGDLRIAFGQDDDRIVLMDLPDLLPHSYFVSRGTPTLISENSRWNVNRQLRSAIRPLLHVSDVAFESWMRGKLGNAESMFTQEILRPSNHDHHALANRALIRARSKRWRDATDDAEKSIKIQPSAIALVAKGLALVGDGKTYDGYRACDSAIAQSTTNDGQFLRIIKSVISCMAEENDETISSIHDLVAMMDDQSIYYSIQAQLYFWFGELQSSREEFDRAVESFKRAQLPTHPLENPYLITMSLIFGWNFEDFSINAQRALCEALCKANSPKEAIETLHKLTSGFGEARLSQFTAEWIVDFTRRCVLALERVGDIATDSRDHEKAAVHFALALSNGQTFSKPILRKWVNAKLTSSNSWRDVLRTALEFTTSRLTIYQAICDVLAGCGSLSEAAECFRSMTDDNKRDIVAASGEYNDWVLDFKLRCGDVAMELRQYDAAIEHYSSAISLQPQNLDAFIKRSKAREAKGLLDDALQDTDKAMELDPSCPLVYETKHAVLRGAKRYDDAIAIFESMLTMIEESTDPKISGLRNNYVATSETSSAVEVIVREIQKQHPLILIDVLTGELCDGSARLCIFKSDPISKELISSMTKKLDKTRIRNVVAGFLKYVMFSHVWTRPEEGKEPLLQDVSEVKSVWALSATHPNEKLRNFCKKTRSLGFRWAWSDTCCIDKLTNAILDQSLTSMYKWYANSAATLVLLVNVDHPSKRGDLPDDLWMTRAWTLQELLAPKVVLFYDSSWKPYLGDNGTNHKDSPEIMQELADAIKISSRTIIAFEPNSLTVREKLRLASKRNATREEDVAYCLIGIFKSDVRPHYGEGDTALGHLLEEIVTRSGEVTVLDWIGKSSTYNTCLPASLSVYSEPPYSPEPLEAEETGAAIARLGGVLTRNETVRFYSAIMALHDASFTHRRLSLPCVIFQTNSLQVHDIHHSSEKEYGAEVRGLGHVKVMTADTLSLREARRLVFVHPWISHIRGPHVVARGHNAGFIATPPPNSSSYSGNFPQVGEYTQALELIARLEQPFNALLLQQQADGKYKRVAAEHAIIVQPEITSLEDVRVETLQIL